MKTYNVYVPMTATIVVEVKAENEDKAKEIAMKVDFSLTLKGSRSSSRKHKPDLCEYRTHEIVAEGNVYHGVLNEIEVEEV